VVEILHVTATGRGGAADAAASMKPEDRDEACRLLTLAVLWRLVDDASKKGDALTWRAVGGPETEAFMLALETGGSHPLLEKYLELRRTAAANRSAPDLVEQRARRQVVLFTETLSRTGLGENEAREKVAKAVKRIFPKKPKRRKGQPSILVDIDADTIRYWQSAYPPFTPLDEKVIAGALKRCGHDHGAIVSALSAWSAMPSTPRPLERRGASGSSVAVNPLPLSAAIS
jgi:hypothetical protein